MSKPIRVYLAGPDLFYPDAEARYERLKGLCANYGMIGVSPVDNDLGAATPQNIRQGNVDLIRVCDGVLANLAMFRGPEPDSGTAYECGFAHALGKTVVGYTGDELNTVDRVSRNQTLTRAPDGTQWLDQDGTQWLDQDGAFIEDFGLKVNLMITGASEVFQFPEDAARFLSDLMSKPEQDANT